MAQVKNPKKPSQNLLGNIIALGLIFGFIFVIVWSLSGSSTEVKELDYTEFIQNIESNNVISIQSKPIDGEVNTGSYTVSGSLATGYDYYTVLPNEEALTYADDDINENWEIYRQKFLKGEMS